MKRNEKQTVNAEAEKSQKKRSGWFNFERMLKSNGTLKLLSGVLAILVWLFVALAVNPNANYLVENVPVNIDVEQAALGALGLNAIGENQLVNVWVNGVRTKVGSLTADDIVVTASLSGITVPGTYDVPLLAYKKIDTNDYVVTDITPPTVQVKFDRMVSEEYEIELVLGDVLRPESFIMETPYVTPGKITVTGPEADVAKVAGCKVMLTLGEEIDDTTTIPNVPIELIDKDGAVIENPDLTLEAETAEVTIPMLLQKDLALGIEFLNVPNTFPLHTLRYTLSHQSIAIAGQKSVVSNMRGRTVGYIALDDIGLDAEFAFEVSLPKGILNLDGVEAVVAKFNTEGMIERTFKSISNLVLISDPANFEARIQQEKIQNVTIIGEEGVVENLKAEDIVAEIDLNDRDLSEGQISVPVRIVIPSAGLAWAYGDYTAVIKLTEKS